MRVGWGVLLLVGLFCAGCSTTRAGGTLHREGSQRPTFAGSSESVRLHRGRAGHLDGTKVAMVSPTEMAARTVASGIVRMDAFEALLVYAGLDNRGDLPPAGQPLTPGEAARLLGVLLRKPVTLANFPPRMGANHLLREVLGGGEVSREELVHRAKRLSRVVVLRPDGYLAWAVDGQTQQKVAPVEWRDGAFRAHGFELGRFYTSRSGVFRLSDAQMQQTGPLLAEVYDDADYISRTLDGAEEAFVELALAIGKLLTYPSDSLAALQHLPAGLVALITSSPEYLERFRYMTRGEQVKALSKLATTLIVTCGAAGGTARTVTTALGGAEATVPVLSLTVEGALVMERVVVPVGTMATVMGTGVGSIYVLSSSFEGDGPSPSRNRAGGEAVESPAQQGKRSFSKGDRAKGLEKAKDTEGVPRCEYCKAEVDPKAGRPNSYEADHRTPYTKGGAEHARQPCSIMPELQSRQGSTNTRGVEAMSKELAAFVCSHVFEKRSPVLLVLRSEGDWQLLCGGAHNDEEVPRVVGLNHLLEEDPSLRAVLELPEEWEAERSSQASPWELRPIV